MQLATIGELLVQLGGRDGALAADAAVTSAEREWCRLGAGWQPERQRRSPDDADPRSERKGHAVQAAGRVWQPAWLRERSGGRVGAPAAAALSRASRAIDLASARDGKRAA